MDKNKKNYKPPLNTRPEHAVKVPMAFDDAMRLAVRVKPEPKNAKAGQPRGKKS